MLRVRNISDTHFAASHSASANSSNVQAALVSLGVVMHTAEEVQRAVELQAAGALACGVTTVAPLGVVEAMLRCVLQQCDVRNWARRPLWTQPDSRRCCLPCERPRQVTGSA